MSSNACQAMSMPQIITTVYHAYLIAAEMPLHESGKQVQESRWPARCCILLCLLLSALGCQLLVAEWKKGFKAMTCPAFCPQV